MELCAFCEYDAPNEQELLKHAMEKHPEKLRRPQGELKYKEAYKIEGHGGPCGSFGMKILVSFGREINENDKRVLYRHIDQIETALMKESVRLDPKTKERNEKDKAEFIALFKDASVFVEEIPNGYGPEDWWYSNFPWYKITTRIGHFKIGWRKRVISIDFSETVVKHDAKDIVPDDVTREGKVVHAWSIEKADEYIRRIFLAAENERAGVGPSLAETR